MQVVCCGPCGMMYQSPRIAEIDMPDAYDSLEEYRHYGSMATDKRVLFGDKVERFEREWALPQCGSFLDIGASHGIMLDVVRERLPKWTLSAVEISPSARASLAARGYDTVASLESIDADARFDWINLDNVLEHMPDPVGTLTRLRRYLSPGGFIYIDVPNESFFSIRYRINDLVRGFRKAPTFPGHVNLFTPPTLKKTIRAAGYRCERFWLESVSAPGRLHGGLGAEETPRVRAVLRVLRLTRIDIVLRFAYFLCARITPA
jgi:SAM-dependent methyltransferase